MPDVPPELSQHPDRLRWNAKYLDGAGAAFAPHPLAVEALALPLPDGPVLDLACGPSGSALLAAEAGRGVTAVDISEVALGLLGAEARRRGLEALVSLVHTDLEAWRPPRGHSLVLCTGFWERPVFDTALTAVAPGGLLAWEAFTAEARTARPGLPARWCLNADEPAALLPAGFTVLDQHDLPNLKRRLLARREPEPA
ncbi:SAM-dependent methyltransferase [Spirillospora sp. NPDC127200]